MRSGSRLLFSNRSFEVKSKKAKVKNQMQQDRKLIIKEVLKPRDIRERTFKFALDIINLCRALGTSYDPAGILSRQLLKSGTSIGANIEEAQAGQSKADFICKYNIALKESRETIYWLRLIETAAKMLDSNSRITQREKDNEQIKAKYGELIKEAKEISKIIGAIIVNTKSKGVQ